MKITLVPSDHVDVVWNRVAPLLQKATDLSGGRYVISDVLIQLLDGERHLFIAYDDAGIHGAITAGTTYYPRKQFCTLHFCGGVQMNLWFEPMLQYLEAWARDTGCDGLEFFGRDGWKRWMEPQGYTQQYRLFEKDLSHG